MHSAFIKEQYMNIRDFSILLIDDDSSVISAITKILIASNPRYYIDHAGSCEAAVEKVQMTYWDTILLDLSIPRENGGPPSPVYGLKILDTLKNELKINAPVIAITGFEGDVELSETVLDMGAYYFLNKPLSPKSIATIVRNAVTFQLTGFDGLTGLLNKITFIERLKSEFERVKRKNNELDSDLLHTDTDLLSHISLIFLDGDNFKSINDRFNHLVGDQVLKKISSSFIDENLYKISNTESDSLKYIIRPYDIAARFGGDEFSLFLPETDHTNALIVARRIREIINRVKISSITGEENASLENDSLTLSIGIATYPFPNRVKNHEELIECADTAMYSSKVSRDGSIYGYSPEGEIIKLE